ncbi:MAG TPA: Type 1 glutamine amidotransferase-like domain-containing protein [Ktedonobacteraceae bacterium]|jgi:cyanophycinase|nr:Type 1 glutamine amidotransferase-like domain-containing protein [Ktedonobacteraceae bacterium]
MATAPYGTVALVGAGEYLPTMVEVDKALLDCVGGIPRVAVVPTAAVPDGPTITERWMRMGVEHFSQLGARVEPVKLFTRADADDTLLAAKLADANIIYFSGGKPRYLLETLQDTIAWQTIKGVFTAGGVVAGCSAGAMVLGNRLFDFPQIWRTIPALGLVPGIAVIPHFDELPSLLVSSIGYTTHNVTVVGIDGATALVSSGSQWRVLGRGSVTVFSKKGKKCYKMGEQVPLASL